MINKLLLLVALTITVPAYAEILKYRGPQGRLIITDQRLNPPYELISSFSSEPDSIPKTTNTKKYQKNIRQYEPYIQKYAKQHRIDPALLHAIIDTESAFNPDARSKAGAIGLMQLMPATAKSLGVKDSRNPKQNIQAGARYLRQLMDKFNQDVQLTLAAYNAGEGTVMRAGKSIPNYPETLRYIEKVMLKYKQLKNNI